MASLYSPNSFSFAPEQLRQVINPLSWLTSGTGQIGLFNVYQTATSKPEVEAEIVKNVAGYGRQLGPHHRSAPGHAARAGSWQVVSFG